MKTSLNRWVSVALAACCLSSVVDAQPRARRATSPAALLIHAGFFHGQAVVVRGTLTTRDTASFTSPSIDRAIPLIFRGASPADGLVELRATFWDVGRMQRDDPRVTNLGLMGLLPNKGEGDWPRPGDVVALIVSDATSVKPESGPPTLRLIAMNPEAYVGQQVTVTGQFRGRNLFGDLPQGPGVSQWDFVLHNADGAIWVTGERPRGKGFNLDPGARVDTRAWLQATGTVHTGRGLVWIEGAPPLSLAKPETSLTLEPLPPPEMGPRPEIIFSDPEDGDADVPLKKVVRLQFSRDMNPDSFKGNVHWHYAAADVREALPEANLAVRYDKANRSVEIRVTAATEVTRFRNIALELTDGVVATDGATLQPWVLTFTFAGQ